MYFFLIDVKAWDIAMRRNVCICPPIAAEWRPPEQLATWMPFLDASDSGQSEKWPVLLLYPQYRQLDVLQVRLI